MWHDVATPGATPQLPDDRVGPVPFTLPTQLPSACTGVEGIGCSEEEKQKLAQAVTQYILQAGFRIVGATSFSISSFDLPALSLRDMQPFHARCEDLYLAKENFREIMIRSVLAIRGSAPEPASCQACTSVGNKHHSSGASTTNSQLCWKRSGDCSALRRKGIMWQRSDCMPSWTVRCEGTANRD